MKGKQSMYFYPLFLNAGPNELDFPVNAVYVSLDDASNNVQQSH